MIGSSPFVVSDASTSQRIARQVRAGRLRRVVRGLYTEDLVTPIETLVANRLLDVIAALRPGAVITGRSAILGGRPTGDGRLFIVHPTAGDLSLPGGILVRSRAGAGPVEGDIELRPGALWMAGPARAALENMVASRSRAGASPRTLSRVEFEEWLDLQAATRGDTWLAEMRATARRIAAALGLEPEADELAGLIGALRGTGEVVPVRTENLRARQRGAPYDAHRVALFDALGDELLRRAPEPAPVLHPERQRVLPFIEAYFSNFIEGTEFTFEEAASIVFDGGRPADRPADAHDIRGTHALVSDVAEMSRLPASAGDLAALLKHRHAVLMAGRPEVLPGEFKERANRFGATNFVEPRLVPGTLAAGFERYTRLEDPFARAAMMMFVVTEVHPFTDGNGRMARVMMNAELVARGEQRLVIPIVYRTNYLMALRGMTNNANGASYLAMLRFAQRYTGALNCTTLGSAREDLVRTNALVDATEADAAGIRLVLP